MAYDGTPGAGSLCRTDTDGSLHTVLALPAPQPTSVCLAQGHLVVTTARHGLDNPSEAAGALLRLPCSAHAPEAPPFAAVASSG